MEEEEGVVEEEAEISSWMRDQSRGREEERKRGREGGNKKI